MKKVIFSILFITFFFLFPISIFAQTRFSQGENVTLQKNQTVNGDYFAAGNMVTVSGTVNGDVYAAGGNILIDGKVNGDLLTAGGTITVRGPVTGNIRVAGGNITISSQVGRNISVAGGNVTITDSAHVGRSIVAATGNMEIFAPVDKGITMAGGKTTIGGVIGGDINSAVEQLTLAPDTAVKGNVTYWSNEKAKIAQDASISGKVKQNLPPQHERAEKAAKGFFAGISLFFKVMSFVSSLIIGLLLLRFAPLKMNQTSDILNASVGRSFFIGLLTLILIPVFVFVLFVIILTIPVAFILLFLYFLLIFLSKIFVSYALTQRFLNNDKEKRNMSPYIVLIIGLVIYEVITALPILGGIIAFIAICLGLGAYLLQQKTHYETLKVKKLA